MKTLSTISFRRKVALLRNPMLVFRALTMEHLRGVVIICTLAAYSVLLYFIIEDAIFDQWKLVSRRAVEMCFVCFFCGISGSVALLSFFNSRFTYLERGCMVFIFVASLLFLGFHYPELFKKLP